MSLYALFADILDYPALEIAAQVRMCASELAAKYPEASELITQFQAEQTRMTLGQLQELYTSTFDMRPDCTPNLGHHLFGDDVRRNIFMAQLKERMGSYGVAMGSELPDNLSFVLRLLEKQGPGDDGQALVEDCLIPAILRMVEVLGHDGRANAYGNALRALLTILQKSIGEEAAPLEALQGPTI